MQLISSFLGSRMRATFVNSSPLVSSTAPRQVTTCMAKKKGIRCIVTIECTEARGLGVTPTRYTTQKNRKNTPERLELKKYNKYLKKYTVHKEIK